MRLIPGNTKVQIEIFKGITLWDMLVGALCAIFLGLIASSTLPFKWVIAGVHTIFSVLLLARLDKEPNYVYLINILRHFSFGRKFSRIESEKLLNDIKEKGETEVFFDEVKKMEEENKEEEHIETKAERKERLKAEKEEYKRDSKLLKSKKLTKEEEDAIWLKRANQSKARKEAKKNGGKVKKTKDGKVQTTTTVDKSDWADMKNLSAFSGISDKFIEYHGKYYGAAIEVNPVEFRFFSEFRRNNSIENSLAAIFRTVKGDYALNMLKIERPIEYGSYEKIEFAKLDELRASFESGFLTEDELKTRVAVVYDRLKEIQALERNSKVVIPFYYLIAFDSDKKRLNNEVSMILELLQRGETKGRRLNDRELALMLKYSNSLDFDERELDDIRPEDYAKWAMPSSVEFTPRTTVIDGMLTHNFKVVSYPTRVDDAWLASLMTYPSTKVMVKMKQMDSSKAIRAIDRSLSELRVTVQKAKTDSEAISAQTHLETLESLLVTLQNDNESLLEVNIYITAYDLVRTENTPRLSPLKYGSFRCRIQEMKKMVRRVWGEEGFRLNNMEFNQAISFIGGQVSGYDPLSGDGRGIPSNTLGASFPWVFPYVMDDKGVKLGVSEGVPVFLDFFQRNSERVNSNMVIVGKSGSGKSYATKTILSNLAADDAKIFVLDPEDEYTELARSLHGKFINVATNQYGRLNPFHIITNLDDDTEGNAESSYSTHLQFLEEFFKQILPDCDKDSLEYLNTLVDRIYKRRGISSETDLTKLKPSDYPIFDDLYDEILREFQRTQNEYIRTMLRTLMNYVSKFSEGGRNAVIWNGPSSITTEENFTVFNFQSLLANRNTTVANAQMLLVLKYIDNEIVKNRDYNEKYGLHRKIVVVIDEAHVFIDTKFPVALDFMFQLAKRIRKYNGMQIVITQNIKDFVGSEEIARKSTAIINACQYSFIFALSPNDMDDLCTLYEKAGGINESEQEQIVQAPRGQAFTIMSPTSRTSFKITAPEDTIKLFHEQNYKNPYFTGRGGDENWANFIKDSVEKRNENIKNKDKKPIEVEEVEENVVNSRVMFDEVSLEDYEEEVREKELEKASSVSFSESFFDDEPVNNETSVSFSEVTTPSVLFEETTESPATQVETKVSPVSTDEHVIYQTVNVPSAPSKTEELLASLVAKLGSTYMEDEIKKAVEREVNERLKNVEIPDHRASASETTGTTQDELDLAALFGSSDTSSDTTKEEDTSSVSLGNIFDMAGMGDLFSDSSSSDNEQDSFFDTSKNEQTIDSLFGSTDESSNEEESPFDVLSFLASAASEESVENDTSIEDFIDGSETILSVSLEQLMSYNKKKNANK